MELLFQIYRSACLGRLMDRLVVVSGVDPVLSRPDRGGIHQAANIVPGDASTKSPEQGVPG
jgi:hypothetical protein